MMLTTPTKILILINNMDANYETKIIFLSSKKFVIDSSSILSNSLSKLFN